MLILHIPEFPVTSPYRSLEPFTVEGFDFILSKNGNFFFCAHDPKSLEQRWSYVPATAKRFGDRRVAFEFMRFLDALPTKKSGESRILQLASALEVPRKVLTAYADPAEQRVSISAWLTTYSGVIGK